MGELRAVWRHRIEKRRMSKVRINDLAKELEVKSRAILDILPELGVRAGKDALQLA